MSLASAAASTPFADVECADRLDNKTAPDWAPPCSSSRSLTLEIGLDHAHKEQDEIRQALILIAADELKRNEHLKK